MKTSFNTIGSSLALLFDGSTSLSRIEQAPDTLPGAPPAALGLQLLPKSNGLPAADSFEVSTVWGRAAHGAWTKEVGHLANVVIVAAFLSSGSSDYLIGGSAVSATACDPTATQCASDFMTNNFCVSCEGDELLYQMSTDASCTIRQPFYNGPGGWRKMTYSSYGLNFALKTSGAEEAFSGSCNGDYSSLNGDGTGSITSTQTNENLELTRTWNLPSGSSSVLTLVVVVKNVGSIPLVNLEAFWGTRDDWVGSTDSPTKEPAAITSGGVNVPVSSGNAVLVQSGNEALLIFSPDPTARGLIDSCCSFYNILNIGNPSTFTSGQVTNDGSYAIYVNGGDLAPGASKTFSFFYGVGPPEGLNALALEVVEVATPSCEDHTECAPGGKCKGGYKVEKKCREKKKNCKRFGHHSIKRWGCADGKSCGGVEPTEKWGFCVSNAEAEAEAGAETEA